MPPQSSRPLARQLLLPVVGLLVAGVLANVAFAAWLAARRHGEEIALRQRQVAETLASSRVALSPAVLTALHNLTGNHFVLWNQRVVRSTLPETAADPLEASLTELQQRDPAAPPAGTVRVAATAYSVTALQPGVGRPETVLVLTPTAGFSRALFDAIWPVLAVAAVTLAVLAPLGVHATDRIGQRIGRIERHVGRIADGDFGRTLDDEPRQPGEGDEISRLVSSINAMSAALAELRSSLAVGERQRLLGQLAAGFAHEFRNGLTGARLAIDLHRTRCRHVDDEASPDESLAVARRQLDIMEEEVHGLLALGRSTDVTSSLIPLDVLLDEVRELVDPRAAHAVVRLTVLSSGGGVVRGRRESLRAAVANLALNAIEAACEAAAERALPHHGSVQIWAEREEHDGGASMVSINVEDSGSGPPTELSVSVFDPFVTGKPEGIGIGLALVKMVADEHGGSIAFERRQGRTRFTLTLPEASLTAVEENAS
ncbi:MAG: HAMP domain-containing sensor histidine kinase [Planctomycetota bacterium]|nr:HAMP domain-containing sensor histidine kinase [Planctomycetota bacterium]MDA0970492.1 HAMP domain-containing sensor histidine kinase [Planctomycetota bacterium]